jgi:hypothetical protein
MPRTRRTVRPLTADAAAPRRGERLPGGRGGPGGGGSGRGSALLRAAAGLRLRWPGIAATAVVLALTPVPRAHAATPAVPAGPAASAPAVRAVPSGARGSTGSASPSPATEPAAGTDGGFGAGERDGGTPPGTGEGPGADPGPGAGPGPEPGSGTGGPGGEPGGRPVTGPGTRPGAKPPDDAPGARRVVAPGGRGASPGGVTAERSEAGTETSARRHGTPERSAGRTGSGRTAPDRPGSAGGTGRGPGNPVTLAPGSSVVAAGPSGYLTSAGNALSWTGRTGGGTTALGSSADFPYGALSDTVTIVRGAPTGRITLVEPAAGTRTEVDLRELGRGYRYLTTVGTADGAARTAAAEEPAVVVADGYEGGFRLLTGLGPGQKQVDRRVAGVPAGASAGATFAAGPGSVLLQYTDPGGGARKLAVVDLASARVVETHALGGYTEVRASALSATHAAWIEGGLDGGTGPGTGSALVVAARGTAEVRRFPLPEFGPGPVLGLTGGWAVFADARDWWYGDEPVRPLSGLTALPLTGGGPPRKLLDEVYSLVPEPGGSLLVSGGSATAGRGVHRITGPRAVPGSAAGAGRFTGAGSGPAGGREHGAGPERGSERGTGPESGDGGLRAEGAERAGGAGRAGDAVRAAAPPSVVRIASSREPDRPPAPAPDMPAPAEHRPAARPDPARSAP